MTSALIRFLNMLSLSKKAPPNVLPFQQITTADTEGNEMRNMLMRAAKVKTFESQKSVLDRDQQSSEKEKKG